MDEKRLKESFTRVAACGDAVPLFFYSRLFLGHPEIREMFPFSMAGQRDKLLNVLGRIVAEVSNGDALVPFLRRLGRDHRSPAMVTVTANRLQSLGMPQDHIHFEDFGWSEP